MMDKNTSKITKDLLEPVLLEQQQNFSQKDPGLPREILLQLKKNIKLPHIVIITGLRRVGKSTLLRQLANSFFPNDFYFVNFDDERLLSFSVSDFALMEEILLETFGKKNIYLFDEIQNIPQWEKYIRRLHDSGKKIFITGSNASLLSKELGTRLTGRHLNIDLFPFSFTEYLNFKGKTEFSSTSKFSVSQQNNLIKYANKYLQDGGIPDFLKFQQKEVLKYLYENVLYRDIITRYNIEDARSLKELSLFLSSNISSLISFNKLKSYLKLGSSTTVKNYIDYLENSWLFFTVNVFDFSVKRQQIAAKKIYTIDNGLRNATSFKFSQDKGKLMENLVFLMLKQKIKDIFYYRTKKNHEVDFYLRSQGKLIQVTQSFDNPEVIERETRSLIEASEELNVNDLTIITERVKQDIKLNGKTIKVLPLYEWLLKLNI